MEDKVKKIKSFLSTDLGIDVSGIGDDSPLFTSGVIDSFALIELLAFLESDLNVEIDIADLDIEKLDTVNSIVKLIP
jgi:acyl carrier protein